MVGITRVNINVESLIGTSRENQEKREELLGSFSIPRLQRVYPEISRLAQHSSDIGEREAYIMLRNRVKGRIDYLQTLVRDAENREKEYFSSDESF